MFDQNITFAEQVRVANAWAGIPLIGSDISGSAILVILKKVGDFEEIVLQSVRRMVARNIALGAAERIMRMKRSE